MITISIGAFLSMAIEELISTKVQTAAMKTAGARAAKYKFCTSGRALVYSDWFWLDPDHQVSGQTDMFAWGGNDVWLKKLNLRFNTIPKY